MTNEIQKKDVINVANSLNIKLTEEQVTEVLKLYDDKADDLPNENFTYILETILVDDMGLSQKPIKKTSKHLRTTFENLEKGIKNQFKKLTKEQEIIFIEQSMFPNYQEYKETMTEMDDESDDFIERIDLFNLREKLPMIDFYNSGFQEKTGHIYKIRGQFIDVIEQGDDELITIRLKDVVKTSHKISIIEFIESNMECKATRIDKLIEGAEEWYPKYDRCDEIAFILDVLQTYEDGEVKLHNEPSLYNALESSLITAEYINTNHHPKHA